MSKPPFFKIQDGRRRKTVNLLKIEYLRNGSSYMHQILVCIIQFAPEQACRSKMSKFIIQDGRRPPYWNLQKPEWLPNRSPNLARSFVLTPPRHRKYQNRHFSKFKMAADEKLKFTKNWIASKRFVRFEPNFAFSINSALGTRLLSHNHEKNRNPRWPMAAILKFTIFQ